MINLSQLYQRLQLVGADYHLPEEWLRERPQLFSNAMVELSPEQATAMQQLISAIETVIALPAYQQHVLSWAPSKVNKHHKVPGVFFGYDFHLTPHGPKLIEINTNAGGAGFIALLEMALWAENQLPLDRPTLWQEQYVSMFQEEWRRAHPNAPLTRIAIIDHQPLQQYYYPEFVLFQTLFKSRGIDTVIADPATLSYKNGQLQQNGLNIDLVYNRLTDFSLTEPAHATLLKAYRENAVVVTPDPHAHALYADKRNLTVLSNPELLSSWGVSPDIIASLQQGVPHTLLVDPLLADFLWTERKKLFFKPVAGYAGKGAYRGQSITKKVFAEVLAGSYIAQELVPPSEQIVQLEEEGATTFKMDIRNYTYQGRVLNIVARLYQGQVTNFRTRGGGFTAVRVVQDD